MPVQRVQMWPSAGRRRHQLLPVVALLLALSTGCTGFFSSSGGIEEDETFCPEKCRCNPGYYQTYAGGGGGDSREGGGNSTGQRDLANTSPSIDEETMPSLPPQSPSLDCRHLDLLDFPAMSRLSKIYAHMYFSYNELSIVHANTFMGHENLIFLDLSHNEIKHIADSSFSNQKDLETLDLSDNKLESVQFEAFYGLDELTTLLLNDNRLVALDGDVFTYLGKLSIVDLSGNMLIDGALPADIFRGMTWLAKVSLDRMGLHTLPKDIFNDQEISLKELSLTHNKFTAVPAASFRPPRSALEIIDLSFNPITTIKTRDFENLYSLKQLYLTHLSELESMENNALYGLRRLETLEVKFCQNLKYISNLTFSDPIVEGDFLSPTWDGPLTTLNLSFNGIQELPGNLLPWAQIAHVDLRNNPYQCDCGMQWILTANISSNYTKLLRCYQPSWLRRRALMHLPPRYFRCGAGWDVSLEPQDDGSARTFRLAVGVGCIGVTVLFLGLLVYIMQRWRVWPVFGGWSRGGGRVCDKCLSTLPRACSSWTAGWSKNGGQLKYVTMHDIDERAAANQDKEPEVYL